MKVLEYELMKWSTEKTCVKIALALEMRMRSATSFATKLSGTATQPASTIAKYAVTASTFMGLSIAMASPFLNPSASRAFATRLHVHCRTPHEAQDQNRGKKKNTNREKERREKKTEAMSYLTLARNCESMSC
jgi:hypothetical protein